MKDELDERSKYLWSAVQLMERNLRVIEEQIQISVKFRESRDAYVAKMANAFEACAAQEAFPTLQKSLLTLAEASKTLSLETHEMLVLRPEQHAIVQLTQIQDWGLVPIKRLLEDRDKAIKVQQKLQKDVDEKLSSGGNKEREKRLKLLQDQKRRVENVNALIDFHMKRFEYFRVSKLKVSYNNNRLYIYINR
jgi:hypothetical protein